MGERAGLALCLSVLALRHAGGRVFSADCNANGIEDAIDVTSPSFDLELQAGTQVNVNADTLVPGDLDGDGDRQAGSRVRSSSS